MTVEGALREERADLDRDGRERIRFEPGRLRELDFRGLAIRFAFGSTISVLVAVVASTAGDRVAGLFLAFPAILPASLTLIAEKDGERDARIDAAGAIIGAIALAAFGTVSYLLLARWPPAVAELAALGAWTVGAVALYSAVRRRAGA